MKAQHKEAFALMFYGCTCGHAERIWNSRDGVTPFAITCPSCGRSTLQHIDFRGDVSVPDYQPLPGQRFFRDGTPQEAVVIIRKRIVAFSRSKSGPIPDEVQTGLLKDAAETTGEWRQGWPTIDRTPDNRHE